MPTNILTCPYCGKTYENMHDEIVSDGSVCMFECSCGKEFWFSKFTDGKYMSWKDDPAGDV